MHELLEYSAKESENKIWEKIVEDVSGVNFWDISMQKLGKNWEEKVWKLERNTGGTS